MWSSAVADQANSLLKFNVPLKKHPRQGSPKKAGQAIVAVGVAKRSAAKRLVSQAQFLNLGQCRRSRCLWFNQGHTHKSSFCSADSSAFQALPISSNRELDKKVDIRIEFLLKKVRVLMRTCAYHDLSPCPDERNDDDTISASAAPPRSDSDAS
jgi:hypothetical protein